MKRCIVVGWIGQDRLPKSWVAIAGVVLIAMLSGTSGLAQAQAVGRYVLVKTVVDREKKSGSFQGDWSRGSETITNGSYSKDYHFARPNFPDSNFTLHAEWKFTPPPAQLAPGEKFTITASGSVSTTEKEGNAATGFSVGGDIGPTDDQGNVDNGVGANTDKQAQVTKVFRLKAPPVPHAMHGLGKKFKICLSAGHGSLRLVNDYYYEWQAGSAVKKGHLSARLDCGTLELVPNQNSESCHIIISGWRRDTANRVEVIFPRQSDGFGSQDKDGKTGIVVPIGQGTEAPSNMSGSRGPDGSYGKEYSWTLFVRARGTALAGTQTIPIIVRQKTGGEVKLHLKVRVVPGRSKQTGPRRDGEGTVTGGTGVTPPITRATSPTGLRVRLGSGSLTLVPGQMSQTCTIFIKGWRTGTGDQVEVFLPQESKLRGNVGNDLVVSPGGGVVDPANMFQTANGEYPYSLSFRAMERAPGVTTMIEIIVRQKGHQEVRLLLRVAVQSAGGISRPAGSTTTSTTTPGSRNTGQGNNGNRAPVTVTLPDGRKITITGKPGETIVIPPNGVPNTGNYNGNQPIDVVNDPHYQKGQEYAEAEKWPQAEAEFRAALKTDPKSTECWDALGDVCSKQGKWKDAAAAHRAAARLEPNEGYHRAQLAAALLKQGRRDEATKEAKEAIRLGMEDHEVYDKLGLTEATR